ncbi:MAG: FtsX-like permease family protein [Ginsengibacter sp.]
MVQTIAPLLSTGKNKLSKWISYFGLGIGVLLLLCSMQMFININKILKENNPRKDGFDFISVTRLITNENMGADHSFKEDELNELKKLPEINNTAPLISNQFRVKASAGNIIPFTTDLFLESIEDEFIDTIPAGFTWQPGQLEVPIIFSSDFLEIYNVFAPTQDLPQLSDKTISSVNIILECYGPNGMQNFKGNIVALSDRINSVLVPKSFMDWANKNFGGVSKVDPSRIYIKTKDANNPKLLSYLEEKGYRINKDKTKFGRVKKVLQNIISALGVFGVLVIVLALMLFSFYLQLMIAKSRDNLQLLLTLGYSPNWLSKTVAKTWIPVYIIVIISAIIFTEVMHYFFIKKSLAQNNNLSYLIHWSVIATAVVLLIISVFINYSLVKKELYKIA